MRARDVRVPRRASSRLPGAVPAVPRVVIAPRAVAEGVLVVTAADRCDRVPAGAAPTDAVVERRQVARKA
jgi:hypothetical protein